MRVALDTSAILAVIFDESGTERVVPLLGEAIISAVNVAEVVTKLVERGFGDDAARETIDGFRLTIMPFDNETAMKAGLLRRLTISKGLSLGDRACLALAIQEKAQVITADRIWAELDLGIAIEVVR